MRFFFLFCALAFSVSAEELHFTFGDCAENSRPTNFISVLAGGGNAPDWKIISADVPSAFAPFGGGVAEMTHSKVLAQTSADMTDERFPMCIYNGQTFRDFKFSARFKIVSGIMEQMAGLVFRFQNSSNFYVTRVSVAGHNIRFYKVVNGIRSDPIGPALNIGVGEWHKLAVQCEGNHITIFLDDRPAMPMLGDDTFTEGKIGFWTKSDSVSYFTDGEVTYTPTIPAAQVMVDKVLEQQSKLIGLRIYSLQTSNTTTVIASKNKSEIGQPGTDAELQAIQDGQSFFGRDHGTVLVTLPLRDRNGDCIGAMRIIMKSFFGETQDSAVQQAMMIRKVMEQFSVDALQK